MKITINGLAQGKGNTNLSIRCPHCGHNGVFTLLANDIVEASSQIHLGQARCPSESCRGHVFFVSNRQAGGLLTYPSEIIPFDKSNIPEKILYAFEEAIKCHSSQCFIASAIMIRKTLEEICNHKKSTGDNLKKRLQDLGGKIMIPKELIEGMDELRLLGNDAAHIEANTFEQIGKEEIEISIEFTKEILKATYQYEDLLGKLRSLKKTNVAI
ncbi:MAG: hypothetical protein JWQ66_2613 [Mucilaginibacter sp.]|nr:hypothetical protein [Mucilaginibacter sp.]